MKVDKKWIVLLIVAFNILAGIVTIPTWFQSNQKYSEALDKARSFYSEDLCVKSIQAYNDVITIKDTLPIRKEMIDTYRKGIDNGEYVSTYSIQKFLYSTIDAYRKDNQVYEYVGQFFFDKQLYEDCAAILNQAKKLGVKSDQISALTDSIRYKYRRDYSMYSDVIQSESGYYTVHTDTYGFLKSNLSSTIGSHYKFASPFAGGYALVKTDEYTFLVNEAGIRQTYFDNNIVDSTGVGNELLACKINDSYSYYNLKGELAFGNYLYAGRFRNNIAAVEDESGWKLIDPSQKYLSDTVFEDIKLNKLGDCAAHGIIFAKINNKYKMYDAKIAPIASFECDDADLFFTDEWAAFKSGDKWGFVDKDGKVQIEPQYEEARSFSNGLAGVKVDGKWSFINNKNVVVINDQFDDVDYFNPAGICFVKRENYWSTISLYYTEN